MRNFPPHLFNPENAVPEGCRFRLATEQDLMPLYTAFYLERPILNFRAYFQRQLDRQERRRALWLVVEAANVIIGSGQCIIYPEVGELANLNVKPDFRNQGIGSAMIELLVELARHIGMSNVEIGVSADNELALKLYCRLGFSQDRTLRMGESAPAIILRKSFEPE